MFTNSLTAQDSMIAGAWNLTSSEWLTLTDAERRDLRNRIVYAPNFATAGK